MIQVNPSFGRKDPRGGYVVTEPHDYDAAGSALRAAFCDERKLPHDMQRALDALDRAADQR